MSGFVLVVTVTCAIVVYHVSRRYGVTAKQAVVLSGLAAIGGIVGLVHGPGTGPSPVASASGSPRPRDTTTPPPAVVLSPGQLARLRDSGTPAAAAIDNVMISPNEQGSFDSQSHTVAVRAGAKVVFGGWAADPGRHDLGIAVVALVDGKPVAQGEYGTERGDVAAYLHVPRYRWTGFRVVVPTAEIPPGQHTFALALVTRGAARYEIVPPPGRLNVATP
jgi:hypothetical protein